MKWLSQKTMNTRFSMSLERPGNGQERFCNDPRSAAFSLWTSTYDLWNMFCFVRQRYCHYTSIATEVGDPHFGYGDKDTTKIFIRATSATVAHPFAYSDVFGSKIRRGLHHHQRREDQTYDGLPWTHPGRRKLGCWDGNRGAYVSSQHPLKKRSRQRWNWWKKSEIKCNTFTLLRTKKSSKMNFCFPSVGYESFLDCIDCITAILTISTPVQDFAHQPNPRFFWSL